SRRVFEGIVPVCNETPPSMWRRSVIATCLRSLAAQIAAFCPAGPLPTTTRSYWYPGTLPFLNLGFGSRKHAVSGLLLEVNAQATLTAGLSALQTSLPSELAPAATAAG